MLKPGCIEPIIYFKNGSDPAHERGYLMLAPYSEMPTPDGYSRESAGTLPEARALERTLIEQDHRAAEREVAFDLARQEARDNAIRDDLYRRMTSGDCGAYEREFIELWMKLRDEKKRKKYEQLYLERTGYLWALHNDIGNRGAGEEVFHPDRHTVKS